MKKILAGAAGAMLIALSASAAQALPLGAGNAASAGATSEVIQVHGLHSACRRDSHGWHRSHLWGRERCIPPHLRYRHHHGKKYWKKKH